MCSILECINLECITIKKMFRLYRNRVYRDDLVNHIFCLLLFAEA